MLSPLSGPHAAFRTPTPRFGEDSHRAENEASFHVQVLPGGPHTRARQERENPTERLTQAALRPIVETRGLELYIDELRNWLETTTRRGLDGINRPSAQNSPFILAPLRLQLERERPSPEFQAAEAARRVPNTPNRLPERTQDQVVPVWQPDSLPESPGHSHF